MEGNNEGSSTEFGHLQFLSAADLANVSPAIAEKVDVHVGTIEGEKARTIAVLESHKVELGLFVSDLFFHLKKLIFILNIHIE